MLGLHPEPVTLTEVTQEFFLPSLSLAFGVQRFQVVLLRYLKVVVIPPQPLSIFRSVATGMTVFAAIGIAAFAAVLGQVPALRVCYLSVS